MDISKNETYASFIIFAP